MAVDAHKNFAVSAVATAPSPATSGTSLVVTAADGAKFPAASFNAVIWPAGVQPTTANAEIVRVTVVSTDTFTITRTQESTSARTVIVGDQIAAGITAKTLTDAETPAESVITFTDITTNNVTSTKHGFAPKSPGIAGKFLNGAATPAYTVPGDVTLAYFESGCVWTADAAGSTRLASMTAGVVWIAGNRLTVAAVTSRTFTASKDVHVDFTDNGDGTAVPTYIDGTTNAASSALTAGGIRNAIIVVGATSIAAAASINQGQVDRVLPIASSIPYSVTDSLGNLICKRTPNLTGVIGYRQQIVNATNATGTDTLIPALSCPVKYPAGADLKITVYIPQVSNSGANINVLTIYDTSVSGTLLQQSNTQQSGGGLFTNQIAEIVVSPSGTSKTYVAGIRAATGTTTFTMGATNPGFIKIEIV